MDEVDEWVDAILNSNELKQAFRQALQSHFEVGHNCSVTAHMSASAGLQIMTIEDADDFFPPTMQPEGTHA